MVRHNFVFNRLTTSRYNTTVSEAEDVLRQRSLVALPEDPMVPKSEASHIPLYILDENAPFSGGALRSLRGSTQPDVVRTQPEPLWKKEAL